MRHAGIFLGEGSREFRWRLASSSLHRAGSTKSMLNQRSRRIGPKRKKMRGDKLSQFEEIVNSIHQYLLTCVVVNRDGEYIHIQCSTFDEPARHKIHHLDSRATKERGAKKRKEKTEICKGRLDAMGPVDLPNISSRNSTSG